MAVSPYFSRGHIARKSEQDLHNQLVTENIKLFGQDIAYIPMDVFTVDDIIRDPNNIVFNKSYFIEAYLPENAETQGADDIMSKFGFRQEKTIDIYIARSRFMEVVSDKRRPMEGDLIFIAGDYDNPYDSYMNDMYEVNYVHYQNSEWGFGHHPTYRLRLQSWIANHEKFNTGIPSIDAFDQSLVNTEANRPALVEKDVKDHAALLVKFDKKNPLSGV